jgi:hypothetical protein
MKPYESNYSDYTNSFLGPRKILGLGHGAKLIFENIIHLLPINHLFVVFWLPF